MLFSNQRTKKDARLNQQKFRSKFAPICLIDRGKYVLHMEEFRSYKMPIYINVKDPPYNAAGDGVTDDTSAIQSAINDAVGETVYFPPGTYLVGALTGLATAATVLVAGNPRTSIPLAKPNTLIMVTLNSDGSTVRNLGFIGPLKNSIQPFLGSTFISVGRNTALSNVLIDNIVAKEASWVGIALDGTINATVQNSDISCGAMCIYVARPARNIKIKNNVFHDLGQSAGAIRGDGILIDGNMVRHAGPVGGGFIIATGSKNVVLSNNLCSDQAGGLAELQPSNKDFEVNKEFGSECVVTGNVMFRIFAVGLNTFRDGSVITNNAFIDCGIGAQVDASTCQPGIVPDLNFPGTNYHDGDILMLSGGTGTPAQFVLTKAQAGGGLCNPATPATNSSTFPITLGNYSAFPRNPVPVTGGHGSGARVIYTNLQIATGGSNYQPGDILRSNNGTYQMPVIVRVTSVSRGVVTGIEVLNGGSFTGTLPSTLTFVNDTPSSGSGFSATPCWGKRYSQTYAVPGRAYALGGLGCGYNLVANNHFTNHASSARTFTQPVGILFINYGSANPHHWLIANNILGPYANGTIKHVTGATYDANWGGGMIFTNNMGYP
jgi:hypothetical protein